MAKIETLIQKLEKVTNGAIARFIIYYYTPEERRKPWDEFKKCDTQLSKRTYEECEEWLTREDAQLALQVYHKSMKLYNMTKLYDSMLQKAMAGDVRAASWCEDFTHSEYFDESQDEIDDFLSGVNIPALKGNS